MNEEESDLLEVKKLNEKFLSLGNRLSQVEEYINKFKSKYIQIPVSGYKKPEEDIEFQFLFKPKGSIEYGFGEYGMAWLGNIVLLIGIAFLFQYLHKSGNVIFSVIAGYAGVATIFSGSYITRKSYSYLSKLFYYNGHLLLFYLTLHLHFSQENPLINDFNIGF